MFNTDIEDRTGTVIIFGTLRLRKKKHKMSMFLVPPNVWFFSYFRNQKREGKGNGVEFLGPNNSKIEKKKTKIKKNKKIKK